MRFHGLKSTAPIICPRLLEIWRQFLDCKVFDSNNIFLSHSAFRGIHTNNWCLAIAQMGNLPNIILAGPPGIGKTSSVICLAREMLGPDVYKNAVLELNGIINPNFFI